jgi:hypothetical protein
LAANSKAGKMPGERKEIPVFVEAFQLMGKGDL